MTITFGIVGSGWRAEFFARLAALMPDRLTLVGAAVRIPERAEEITRRWHVPAYLSPEELAAKQHPDFVVTSVPWPVNPEVIATLVEAKVRVLAETPPAPDEAGLHDLWVRVGERPMVQVAEQYLLMPGHAARREIVARGMIGKPTRPGLVDDGYHAVSMIRGLLGVGFERARVVASSFTAPLLDPLTRAGWTGEPPNPRRDHAWPRWTSAAYQDSTTSPTTSGTTGSPARPSYAAASARSPTTRSCAGPARLRCCAPRSSARSWART